MTSRLPNLLGGAALLAAFAFGFANVATAQTITVSGCTSFTTAGGTSANITITCNTGAGGGGATPPSCSNANIATVGSPVTSLTLTATCTQGTNPITSVNVNGFPQCGGSAPACTNPSFQLSIPLAVPLVTTNYTVTASDGSLQGSATATYFVAGGGGGAADLSGCTNALYTGRLLDVAYPTGAANTSITNGASKATPGGNFGNNDALVVRFTTPALGVNDQTVFQPAGNPPSQNTGRIYTVSKLPCEFATSNTPTGSIVYATYSQSPAIGVYIKAGGCPYSGAYAGYCKMNAYLEPNTTYYITMVNRTGFGGTGSCVYGSCDMRIDFNK